MKRFFIILPLFFCLLFTGCDYSFGKSTSDYNDYLVYIDKLFDAPDYMPTLENCGNYKSFTATYKQTGIVFVTTQTVALFLEYDQTEYQKQVKYINERYHFFDKTPSPGYVDIHADVNGYDIRMVNGDINGYNQYIEGETYIMEGTWYKDPAEKCLLIGTNATENKVCYMYQFSSGLDIIDDLDDFVKKHFHFV